MADLDAGCTGAMTGGGYPDGIRQIMDPWFRGDRAATRAAYARWLPLINHENRQCGLITAKILMKAGGIIACDDVRHPLRRRRLRPRLSCWNWRASWTYGAPLGLKRKRSPPPARGR